MPSDHLLFLGTYTRTGSSKGIYSLWLDGETGALSAPRLVAELADPGWLALTPDRRRLYAAQALSCQVAGFSVDAAAGALVRLPDAPAAEPAVAPAHLAIDATGQVLLAANYHAGFVAAIPLGPDGSPGQPRLFPHTGRSVHPTRQEKAHVHSVTLSPDNRHAIVADLGTDRIHTYALDAAAGSLQPAQPPSLAATPGAGPRHSAFGPDGRHLYVANELANTVTVYTYAPEHGRLAPVQTIATLPPDFAGVSTAAEIRMHPQGRFVYVSNRGHDSLAVFAVEPADGSLRLVEIVASGGRTPRNFALSPDGRWLVCGHQASDLVTVFRVDPGDGRLALTPHTAPVSTCICVVFHH